MAVSDDRKYFYDHLQEVLNHFEQENVKPSDILNVIEGYKGLGYGLSTDEELGL